METAPKYSSTCISIVKIITTVLFIVLPFLGFFLGMNYQTSVTESAQVPTTLVRKPTPTPKQGIVETANWKTYSNLDKGYSIKYPESLFVRLDCPNEELDLIKRGNEKETSIQMPTCARGTRYELEIITVNASNKEKSIRPLEEGKNPDPDYFSVTKEDITIDGIKARKYITKLIKEYPGPAAEWSEDIYFDRSGKIYWIYFGDENLTYVFDQILSTFKFL